MGEKVEITSSEIVFSVCSVCDGLSEYDFIKVKTPPCTCKKGAPAKYLAIIGDQLSKKGKQG